MALVGPREEPVTVVDFGESFMSLCVLSRLADRGMTFPRLKSVFLVIWCKYKRKNLRRGCIHHLWRGMTFVSMFLMDSWTRGFHVSGRERSDGHILVSSM